MVVWVEEAVLDDQLLLKDNKFQRIKEKLVTFRDDRDTLTDRIDFIVCLGGDGTLLYASSLFQQSVPPVMAFHLGSLGFLTPFQFDNFQEQVTNVLEGNATLTLRSRLRCIIVQKQQHQDKDVALQSSVVLEDGVGHHQQLPSPPVELMSPTCGGGKPTANILVCHAPFKPRPIKLISFRFFLFLLNIGFKRSGRRPRTITVPEQHRSLSGRQTHNIGAGRRFDHFNTDGKYSLFGFGRRFNGTSIGSMHYGDSDLSAFA